ncbi:hypothetical protein BH11ACT4_BH11ACT4_24330 [soil metagenome]
MITVDILEDSLLERWVTKQPHASSAVVQGPNIPTIAELRNAFRRLIVRLSVLNGWAWVAAASIVGFEGLEVLLVSMVAAPEFVPLLIVALALAAVIRNRWLRRSDTGLRRGKWLR